MFKLRNIEGPLLIMTAATLWAMDALIRTPLSKTIPATSIVFYEHLVGLFVLSPLFVRSLPILKKITVKTWGQVILLSLISSVAGTVLFTQALASSFATFDFITPILLQKLQPLIVITLSALILKEKFKKEFFLWAAVALAGSYLMSFGFSPVKFSLSGKELVVVLALGATACWGIGTILSKLILKTYSTRDATFLRFLTAVPLSLALALTIRQYYPVVGLTTEHVLRFTIIALSTGAVGLLIYYRGLTRTKAHISSIAELMFPLVSIIIGITSLNPYGTAQTLTLPQGIGIVALLIAITKISLLNARKNAIIVRGDVVKGAGDGKKIGFPTANVRLTKPPELDYGVYACKVTIGITHVGHALPSSTHVRHVSYPGIVHYGPRVVFGEEQPQFEVHIFEFKQNLYGKMLEVEVKDFIRGTEHFGSIEALVKKMNEDCEKANRILQGDPS